MENLRGTATTDQSHPRRITGAGGFLRFGLAIFSGWGGWKFLCGKMLRGLPGQSAKRDLTPFHSDLAAWLKPSKIFPGRRAKSQASLIHPRSDIDVEHRLFTAKSQPL